VAHTTHRHLDLQLRCATALFGHAGLEWDLTSLTPDELGQVTGWIALYRELRPLLHAGRVVRADLPGAWGHDDALLHGVVAQDGSQALYAYVQLTTSPSAHPGLVRLPGLDPLREYHVQVRTEIGDPATVQVSPPPWWAEGVRLPGALLSQVGLTLPALAPGAAVLLHLSTS
jgi:alpha-galactosidase